MSTEAGVKREPTYFVLRAKTKELLLKMFDDNPDSKQMLNELKRSKSTLKKDSTRSKKIRMFIKD